MRRGCWQITGTHADHSWAWQGQVEQGSHARQPPTVQGVLVRVPSGPETVCIHAARADPNRQILSLVLCVDLVDSRRVWPAQVGCLVDPDGSRRIPSDRLDDQTDDQGPSDTESDGASSSLTGVGPTVVGRLACRAGVTCSGLS